METLKNKTLFWDISLSDLDLESHQNFIIERVLSKGDVEDFQWAMNQYDKSDIVEVIKNRGHRLDRKSLNFWCMYFNIDIKNVRRSG